MWVTIYLIGSIFGTMTMYIAIKEDTVEKSIGNPLDIIIGGLCSWLTVCGYIYNRFMEYVNKNLR